MGDLTKKKMKVIGRRSESENQWCDDLVEWIIHSGITSQDPLFSRLANKPDRGMSHKVCTSKSVRTAVKEGVVRAGLDPDLFSFHSLRKGAITLMNAKGVPKEQILDRGNYSASSTVMDNSYNYDASGLGPRAANALTGGCRPGLDEVRRWMPARHESTEERN